MMNDIYVNERTNQMYFPGYKYIPLSKSSDGHDHNIYKGYDVSKGGLVIAEPGMYGRTVVLDVSGLHPASIRAMNCFGEYTKNFGDIVDARVAIKHKDYDSAKKMFNGRLAKYLDDPNKAKQLSKALKIAVNSVYGLTSSNYDVPFHDDRNVNNIVALRGALFMYDLREEVIKRGFKVIAIKTDSIKIVNPTDEIIAYCKERGKAYGYSFEVENIFEKICLVNNAVFIAKCANDDPDTPGKWKAVGTQFAIPYIFKTLFSHEQIEFNDYCQTKEVKTSLCLDFNECLGDDLPWSKIIDIRKKLKANPYAKITNKDRALIEEYSNMSDNDILEECNKHHNYKFVGSVGSFVPVVDGIGGGILLRTDDGGGYSAVTGSKGYRWLESEQVKALGMEDKIDKRYFKSLVDDAVANISQYGDFEWFVSDDPVPPLQPRVQNLDINSQIATF